MKVYRIQFTEDCEVGAYTANFPVCCEMANEHSNDPNYHPAPINDTGIDRFINPDEYCGFTEPAQLLKWFRGYIPQLLQSGFEIVCLTNVTITAIGEYQCLFEFNYLED